MHRKVEKLLRSCVACKKKNKKNLLLRIVKQGNGIVFVDRLGKADGRGAYICYSRNCFDVLKRKRGLEKIFKCSIDRNIYSDLEKEFY